MTPAELLQDAYDRIVETGTAALSGLTRDQLAHRVGPYANPIGWLIWHSARQQDAQVAEVAGTEEVWTAQGFVERFGLALDPADTGYGHTNEQVAAVRASGALLTEYLRATHAASIAYLATVTPDDLDRIVDHNWDPPVSLGVRLVSVVDDAAQHVGQAAYVRGLLT